jgi:hypothetical protein
LVWRFVKRIWRDKPACSIMSYKKNTSFEQPKPVSAVPAHPVRPCGNAWKTTWGYRLNSRWRHRSDSLLEFLELLGNVKPSRCSNYQTIPGLVPWFPVSNQTLPVIVLHLCGQVQAETPFGLLLNVAHPDGKETGDTAEIFSCLDWGK